MHVQYHHFLLLLLVDVFNKPPAETSTKLLYFTCINLRTTMKKFLRLVIAVTIISFTHMLLLTAKVYRIEYAAYMTNNDDGISFHQDVDDVTKINGSDPNADDLSSSKNEDDGDDEDDEKEEKEDKEGKDSILELKELEEELNLRKEMDITCPPELIFLQDQITEALITQILHYDKTNIPRVIHVIVETKCIRTDIYNRIKQMLETMNNYSILFHDRMDVDKVLTKERVMIPNLNDVVKCITSIEYEIDLIKLLLIWEYGGIVADLEYILGRENVLIQDKLDNNDEAFLLKNSTDSLYFPLAIGTKRSHPVVYMMIQKFISNLFQQYGDESVFKTNDDLRRHNMLEYPMRMFFPQLVSHDALKMKSQYFGLNNRSVTVFNVTADGSHDEDYGLESILLKQKNNFPCVNFESTYHMNFEDLIQISGTDKTYSCSDPLLYFEDKIDPDYNMEESRKSGRKIPKVVHMTSKSRCLTDNYTDNTASWLFPGHSIVLHDDDAVARLMQRKWPEFPHLHDARKCITSGAGMADVWRYLVLWEYGGVYTDIDNAPGPRFLDGSLIKNEMDAFLEVESGSFPVSTIL